jgi:hypothetical protein
MSDEKIEESKQVAVPIEWDLPDGLITPFATNMVIQTIENEFKISFFEVKPKIHLSDSEPLPNKIKAICIASVIVTADRLPKFIEVLQSQLDKYNNLKKQIK